MTSQGILFVATGKRYIRAAVQAARSVPKFSPGLPVHLFADYRQHGFDFDSDPAPFTSVGNIPEPHRRSKIDYLPLTPFERTLYLDTDTALNADIRDLFQILDRFDLALCHAHRRNEGVRTRAWHTEIPGAFPQFNSGVFLYRRTPAVLDLLHQWSDAYHQAGFPQDQTTLRELIWLSDLRIATLPPEYNVRFMKYHYLWTHSEATTQIFHLRRFHDGRLWFIKLGLKKLLRPAYHFLRQRGLDLKRIIDD